MKKFIIAPFWALMLCTACDDGRIYEQNYTATEGKTVVLTGTLQGLDDWTDGYNVSIAGFDDADDYAFISKVLTPPQNGSVHIADTLSGIPAEVRNVQLCVINRLRQHVVTFSQMDVTGYSTRDTIRMDVGTINVGMFQAIQQSYFNTTCANCHGATGRAAAGLFLTEGQSYEALVGVASKKVSGQQLVSVGQPDSSILYQALTTDLTKGWREYHRDLVSEQVEQKILPILKAWIQGGAKQ